MIKKFVQHFEEKLYFDVGTKFAYGPIRNIAM